MVKRTDKTADRRTKPGSLIDYRGRHAGETIIVCGCGASLADFEPPPQLVTIGVNDVGRLFDPTYLVVLNACNQFRADRFRYVERSCAEAVFSQLDLHFPHRCRVRVRLGKRGGTEVLPPDRVPYTRNSPYVAVVLASYMGARRIGLIGVDFTNDHFFAATGVHRLTRELKQIDAEYGRLHAALQSGGVELVNISSASRLTSLPKVSLEQFTMTSSSGVARRRQQAKERPMRISVERSARGGCVAQFLDTFATTAAGLGCKVDRDPAHSLHKVVSVVWNGRRHSGTGPTLYCEHGWLPRWEFQISTRGINADSHVAPFRWDGQPLDDAQRQELQTHLAAVRCGGQRVREDMQTGSPRLTGLPQDFILVPLQMEMDTNIVRHVPARYRRMQSLIDAISAKPCPYPVIYKQHPADARRGNRQLRLRVRSKHDMLWRHSRGNVYQLLKSGRCRGIVSLNSNVVHDGLLWDIPAAVLGRNVWPRKGVSPFLLGLPRDWSELTGHLNDTEVFACRESYAYFLMSNQWSTADISDPAQVRQLLGLASGGAPLQQRRRVVTVSSVTDIEKVQQATPKPRRPVRLPSRRGQPQRVVPLRINVCVRRRDWLFGDLAAQFARVCDPRISVVVSDRPVRTADGWLFIRTHEAGETPDPLRTVVQVHDNSPARLYKRGGARAGVQHCGGIVLTHPTQRDILLDAGVSLEDKRVLCKPPGALEAFTLRQRQPALFTLAWVGRPSYPNGADVKGVGIFVNAVRALARPLRVVLLGERLDDQFELLRGVGVDCVYHRRNENPIEAYPRHYQSFDCVAISSMAVDGPPMPLFEALASGIPVVSTRAGWAPELIRDGQNGYLVDDAAQMAAAISRIREQRDQWFERRGNIRASLGDSRLEAWIQTCLELTLTVADTGTARHYGRSA